MEKEFNSYQKILERAGGKEQKRKDHYQVIENYYDENITQIENCEEPINGRQKIHEIESQNLDGVNSVETKIEEVIFDNKTGTVWGQMIIKFDSKKNGKQRIEEAFIQKWSNGKIIYQRFFYGQLLRNMCEISS